MEVSHQSYCGRLSNSLVMACIGVVVFFAGLGLTGWNEYRSVATSRTISAARDHVLEAQCSPIDPNLDGELVHTACDLSGFKAFKGLPGLARLKDSEVTGIRLQKSVEVFEWHETVTSKTAKDPVGGGTSTVKTYSYDVRWQTAFEDSGLFKPICATKYNYGKPCININPATQPWWNAGPGQLGTSTAGLAVGLQLGDYTLPSDLISKLGVGHELAPVCDTNPCPPYLDIQGTHMYYKNLNNRDVSISTNFPGDVRVQYSLYNASQASILAKQTGVTFAPWQGPYDASYTMYEAEDGLLTAEDMLEEAEAANAMVTWLLRAVTLSVTAAGLGLVGGPAAVAPDVIPCVGGALAELAGCAVCCVSAAAGAVCWLLVAGTAWLWYRPLIGVPLLLCAVGVTVFALHFARRQRKGQFRPGSFHHRPSAAPSAPLLTNMEDGMPLPAINPAAAGPTAAAAGGGGCAAPPAFCGACGATRGPGAHFCGGCGARY